MTQTKLSQIHSRGIKALEEWDDTDDEEKRALLNDLVDSIENLPQTEPENQDREEQNEPTNPEEEWEQNNSEFSYTPPDEPPDQWDSSDYTELIDRAISRRTQYLCDLSSTGPFSTLKKARSHIRKNHLDRLIEKAEAKADYDADQDDNGSEEDQDEESKEERIKRRKEENAQLSKFDHSNEASS